MYELRCKICTVYASIWSILHVSINNSRIDGSSKMSMLFTCEFLDSQFASIILCFTKFWDNAKKSLISTSCTIAINKKSGRIIFWNSFLIIAYQNHENAPGECTRAPSREVSKLNTCTIPLGVPLICYKYCYGNLKKENQGCLICWQYV